MNLKAFLRGLTLILTSNPLDTLRLWSKGEGEEAQTIRYALYIVNFIGANLGIIILILSVYVWFMVNSPNVFTLTDTFGHTFTINDFKNMYPTCLLQCNATYTMNKTG